jgi:hypothetical protein
MQSTAPTSFAIPNPFPTSSASTFDYNAFLPGDYDWSKATTTMMDMDFDADIPTQHDNTAIRKLEFTGADSDSLANLGDLDISFDTSPSDGGKIRVRIHPPSVPSSRESSVKPDTAPVSPSSSSSSLWSATDPDSFSKWGISSTPNNDPFLGVGSSSESADFGMMMPFSSDGSIRFDHDTSGGSIESETQFGSGESYVSPDGTQGSALGGKRRVRIALKSMPQAGGEGGEWEVQLC